MKQNLTIKEVAEAAGVSAAAVSRYLNGGSVSEEKRAQIHAVIEKTGYRPNAAAQHMRTGRAGQIGAIVPRVYSDAVSQILEGASWRLSEENYMLMLGVTDGDTGNELRYLDLMQQASIDGILLMGTVLTPFLRDHLLTCEKPVVVTGQDFVGIPCVYHDDLHAMQELMDLMLQRGRNEVAYIGATEEDLAVGKARREGAMKAWQLAGRDLRSLHLAVSAFSAEGGEQCMQELLRQYPGIDGVLCATDRIAMGAMAALRRAGRRMPEDVSIAGVGDSWAGTLSTPALTTVHLYYRQCGIAAADMLLQRIGSTEKDLPATQTRLGYRVIARDSL